eukprot:XP_019927059.1 PREDICTED: COMM domain-containing protein 6-like [Crassostrea gigas]
MSTKSFAGGTTLNSRKDPSRKSLVKWENNDGLDKDMNPSNFSPLNDLRLQTPPSSECLNMDLSERGLTAGKLVDMKWKLGVAVCSDECKSLNSPFVAMTLKVADASGKISTHTFELTIPQFQNFSEQMKDMAARMEMI